MKWMMAILVLAAATALAQNLDQVQNARDTMKAVQQKKANDSNAALDAAGQSSTGQSSAKQSPMARPSARLRRGKGEMTVYAPKPAGQQSALKAKHMKKDVEQVSVEASKAQEPSTEDKDSAEAPKEISYAGKRDPFVSPVVNRAALGSGCSTGKKCLAIDQIELRGVVKSDAGMIAVVVNSLDKAYFLRENDPVFDGYVVKITGDSIIFKETVQDRLGKPATKEVTKRILTPAV